MYRMLNDKTPQFNKFNPQTAQFNKFNTVLKQWRYEYNLYHINVISYWNTSIWMCINLCRHNIQQLHQQRLPRKYDILCRSEVSGERKVNVSKAGTEATLGGVVE